MRIFCEKKGTSLVEILIAVGIFALAAVITSNLLFEVVKLQKRSNIQNSLYEDARLILQRITHEIQNGTVDYDEYFSTYVIQDMHKSGGYGFYGLYHGAYGSRFYDPGKKYGGSSGINPDDLGIECSVGTYPDCEIIYTLSTDLNTGQNPFSGDNVLFSNAFCDTSNQCLNTSGEVDELYLIDNTGTIKTIIGKKKTGSNEYAIGMVRMEGSDLDQNGVVDTFSCMDEFVCFTDFTSETQIEKFFPGVALSTNGSPLQAFEDLGISVPRGGERGGDPNTTFDPNTSSLIPFTPLGINVVDLRFVINPVEDPYKAFAEVDMQSHPSVTVILTLGLTESTADKYPGTLEPITVQTTVAAGVIGGIASYPPTNDVSWISGLSGIGEWP